LRLGLDPPDLREVSLPRIVDDGIGAATTRKRFFISKTPLDIYVEPRYSDDEKTHLGFLAYGRLRDP
jgi:hypothetical protein